MAFLRWLEQMRNPVLDCIFSAITTLGQESIFIIIGLIFIWCINKKYGYFLMCVGAAEVIINQFLKMVFRIPRPWVNDPEFTIVESARAEADGYSFPSGHTQIAIGVYGGIACLYPQKIIRIPCILLAVFVGFSRMYLGVHTPWDVLASAAVASLLILALYPRLKAFLDRDEKMDGIFLGIIICAILYIAYVTFFPFPPDVDPIHLRDSMENGYKTLGAVLGIWFSYRMDLWCIHYDTRAVWWGQLFKMVGGAILVLFMKAALKEPLLTLLHGHAFADTIRYFIIVSFVGCVWPLTFRLYPSAKKAKITSVKHK